MVVCGLEMHGIARNALIALPLDEVPDVTASVDKTDGCGLRSG